MRVVVLALPLIMPMTAVAVAGQAPTVYLTLDQAPKSIFPDADIERKELPSTPAFQSALKTKLGRLQPTMWEASYPTFTARKDGALVGYAVVVQEIGKHDPFTLIVSVDPAFKVRDVALMVYRETRGGEIAQRRFLAQYKGKRAADPIQLDRDIVGISGATLSVQGANRAVHKAIAVLELAYRPNAGGAP